jgi:hypothetical protein
VVKSEPHVKSYFPGKFIWGAASDWREGVVQVTRSDGGSESPGSQESWAWSTARAGGQHSTKKKNGFDQKPVLTKKKKIDQKNIFFIRFHFLPN